MATDNISRVFALAARDLVVALAAGESFATFLDPFARRRAAVYVPGTAAPTEEAYWPGIAAALAGVAPPEGMPMAGLIAAGATLERGARGLRGLFTSTPSDKDRKKVARVAALAARVMEIVAGADNTLTDDERRGIAMAMASFGLSPDELTAARPGGRMTPAQLEIFGELEPRVRRELVRGAWQLCLRGPLHPAQEEAVRAVAAKLDIGDQATPLRAEVEAAIARQGDTAALAVELARAAGSALAEDTLRPAMEHLIRAAAPPARAAALRAQGTARGTAKGAPHLDALHALERGRRVQAVAMAWATVVGTDPAYSAALHARGALTTVAAEAGAAYEVNEALDVVDRFLHQRVSEANGSAPEPAEA